MPRLPLYAVIAALSIAHHARAIDVTIRSAIAPPIGTSEGTLIASTVIGVGRESSTRSARVSIPGQTTIDLPEGVWRLQIKAAAWFHGGDVVTVGKETESITLPVWPLGTIRGKIKTSDDALVSELTARWSASTNDTSTVPSGESPCTLTDNDYRCDVPAETLDVQLKAKGYASQFLLALKVPPRALLELPVRRFERGAGAYGWVTAGDGVRFNPSVTRVRLTPIADSASATTAPIDARGFFAFSGLAPGTYRIAASAGQSARSEDREITIREDRETELLRPLVLERLVPLSIAITPANDPAGNRWSVVVSRTRQGRSTVVNRSRSSDTGIAIIPNLAPGPYELSIVPEGQSTAFVTRAIEMPRDAELTIRVQTTSIAGTVQMRDQPLISATLWIGGKHHEPAVTLTSGAEGAFSGVVPFDPNETWTITISTSRPTIERTVTQRPSRENDNTYRLDLTIPAAMIEGIVLQPDGQPANRGIVNMIRADDPSADLMQARIGADGTFELAGLDAGDYTVYAEGSGGRTSPRTKVHVSEEEPTSVKLTLGSALRLRGRLTTEDGSAISGANVYVNSVEVPAPVWIPRTTGMSGDFEMRLPEGTRNVDVLVIAAGFAFKSFRTPLDAEQQLAILLRQNGGRIEISTPASDEASGRLPYLLHQSTAVPVMFLLSSRIAMRQADGANATMIAPHMEPGAYGLCYATPAEMAASQNTRCSFGNLAPFGSLSLSVE